MDKKTTLILNFVCFIVSSDANMKVVRRHDDMPGMGTPGPPMTPTSGDSGMGSHDMSSMMHMSFFWGKNTEILFSGWPGTRAGMYVLALVVVFALAVVVEWLSHSRLLTAPGPRSVGVGIVQTAVYAIRVGIAYLVMLALMSFNGGVFIVAVVGHSVGFLVFGSRVWWETAEKEVMPAVCG